MSVTVLSLIDTQSISLELFLQPEDLDGRFDRIQIFRSMTGENGFYEEITGETYTEARIANIVDAGSGTGPLVPVQGKSVKFIIDNGRPGAQVIEYTFTGASPITLAAAASQLNAAFGMYIFAYLSVDNTTLVVRTVKVGADTSLEVVPSDASSILGLPSLPPLTIAYGRDPRLVLISGKQRYSFFDVVGHPSYYYKFRLYNRTSGEYGAFSIPIKGGLRRAGVLPDDIVTVFMKAVSMDGRALVKQEVVVHNSYYGQTLNKYAVIGGSIRKYTDDSGYVEFHLVRGAIVDVSVIGTSLMRRIKVPVDKSIFNVDILDPSISIEEDAFAVQRPAFSYANRKNL